MNKKDRISIRLTPYQNQVLTELSTSLNTSISMLVRTIVGDFITRNEEVLERLVMKNNQIVEDTSLKNKEEDIFDDALD